VVKPLLTILLALVQVTAWGRAPLYLCVSGDGTVCVDLGPDLCDCCHHESPADSEHACSAGCDHHEHAAGDVCGQQQEAQVADDSLATDPCDCTHIGLAARQDPAIVRANVDHDHDPSSFASLPLAVSAERLPLTIAFAERAIDRPLTPSYSLALLATVVLRC
jgi:hypothetical protein